jgi:predicted nucleic acid-binding protein
MKKALLDTNVVLDVLLNREPHVTASAAVWAAVENGLAKGFLAAHSVTTIHYLIRREQGNAQTKRIVAAILRVFAVAAVDEAAIREALARTSHTG